VKRSEINGYLHEAEKFFRVRQFALPPFAFWSPAHWVELGDAAYDMLSRGLGWDITDFGSGRFLACGLLLFTIRNGLPDDPSKIFAEKIMQVRVNQRTPMHYHFRKTEDIINRGGGRLVMELYNADQQGNLDSKEVRVRCDGLERIVAPGGQVVLESGESITLVPGVYHSFYAADGDVMAGEVSSVNDDTTDNRFYEPLPRFTEIEEDVPPLYMLSSDYHSWNK
jgi:D-lyxose ketol-isomerase